MDNNNDELIWVFIAADEALPTAIFNQKKLAEDWVRDNGLPGTLAAFPINKPVPPTTRPLAPFIGDHPTLKEHTEHLLGAISKCVRSGFHLPALMLIYSTIDVMAWLDRDEEANDVTRSDFLRWADTYLLPDSDLGCTAIDLYAARCAILHSYSAESRLTREGIAKTVYYAWGTAREETLRAAVAQSSLRGKVRVVHISNLLKALRKALAEFIHASGHLPLIQERIAKFYTIAPSSKYRPAPEFPEFMLEVDDNGNLVLRPVQQ
jgi:hypothetical protein